MKYLRNSTKIKPPSKYALSRQNFDKIQSIRTRRNQNADVQCILYCCRQSGQTLDIRSVMNAKGLKNFDSKIY